MRRYLFAIDEDGREIPGTRRSLDHCRTPADAWQVEQKLKAQLGDDCRIRERKPSGEITL